MTSLASPLYPLKLPPSFRERIWGARDLSPFFGRQEKPVGEAWYSFEENRIANGPLQGRSLGEVLERYRPQLMGRSHAPLSLRRRSPGETPGSETGNAKPYFPILTKLLFTSRAPSVQVHPDDAYALANEGGPGKTELWYVVAAKPGASMALGLRQEWSREDLRRAAESGEIEKNLNWVEVRAGQMFFIPAGTIHAAGPGLVFYEVQQNSDLTYRLYDFGRLGSDGKPRDLHIDQAAQVSEIKARPRATTPFRFPAGAWRRELLTACSHFAVERLGWKDGFDYPEGRTGVELLMFLEGGGEIGGQEYRPGDCYLLPAESLPLRVEPSVPTKAVRTYVPDLDLLRAELQGHQAGEDHIQRLLA